MTRRGLAHRRRRAAGYTMIEVMMVVGVVAILALMAMPSYMEKIVRDQIVEAMPLADLAKGPVAAAWAAGAPLPANNAAAGLPAADKIVGNLVSSTQVQDGAIHLTFGNRANGTIRGKILTLRPAVVADAPIVPVAWVCGNAPPPDKMTVKGINRTDVPTLYLPFKCRP
jgi:type IV pilus assembly protein PilA